MKITLRLIFLLSAPLLVFGCSTVTPSPEFAKWASVKSPSIGTPHVYGTYQAGCLAGAQTLPLEGRGYFVVHRSRERYYGHITTINYLTSLGKKINQKKYPTMMVSDISFPRGGPFLNGHASHQIGLDVDISLQSTRELPTSAESESWGAPSYVQNRKTLRANWGAEQIQLIELAADFPEVNRIFVAPAIKKYFCDTHSQVPWLYKLRSWWGHDEHIHVRLNCPTDSLDCQPQAELDPKNNGCGAELDWWYSSEADEQAEKNEQESPRPFPNLPAQCETVKTDR